MKVKITVGVVLAAIVIAAVLIFFPRKTAPEVRFTALSGENCFLNTRFVGLLVGVVGRAH
jgi:hypothetical protein